MPGRWFQLGLIMNEQISCGGYNNGPLCIQGDTDIATYRVAPYCTIQGDSNVAFYRVTPMLYTTR